MSLLQSIKEVQLSARKARKSIEVNALTTLIGEAEAFGKNNGNREPTDAEVIQTLRKFVKNAHETARIAGDYRDASRADQAWAEIELYELFLPKLLTETELKIAIEHIIIDRTIAHGQEKPKMGLVMQDLKALHEGLYDGKLASQLIKDALA